MKCVSTEYWKGRDNLEDLGVDCKIILNGLD
jgi:hypothetical protein